MFSIYLTLLISATSTGFFILKTLEIKQERELEQFKLQLEAASNESYNQRVREKLINFNRLLQEMALDFSLIFPTIDCSAKMSQDNFYNKYRALWAKVSEVQMITNFYAPSIRELAEDLDKLTICYWKHLHKVLVIEESIDRSSPDYLETISKRRDEFEEP